MQPAPAPPRITLHLGGHKQALQGSAGATTAGDGGAAASKPAEQHQQHQSTKKTSTSSSRIATAVAADLAALSNPDVDTAFRDADDAVDRLLPYHLLAQEGPEAADADEVDDGDEEDGTDEPSTSGRGAEAGATGGKRKRKFLLLSRRQAWLEVSARRAASACDSLERTERLVAEAEERSSLACERRPEELWLVSTWEREEAEARLRRARREQASAAAGSGGGLVAPAPLPIQRQQQQPPPGYYRT